MTRPVTTPESAPIVQQPLAKLHALIRALRPYQWVKNLLVFVPLVTSNALSDLTAWKNSFLVFLAFCAVASALYLINDIGDLAADRAHPRKSSRPFAQGRVTVTEGLIAAAILAPAGAILAWAGGAQLALSLYVIASLSYTLKLKEMPLVDVFLLAALYGLRQFGGGEASGYSVSLWLLGFSSFLFLNLALIKRVSELIQLRGTDRRSVHRRGYIVDDIPLLQTIGCGASFASVVVLSLYLQSDTAVRIYASPSILWGEIPLILFWQCRLWLSTARGYMHDDPIVYAARDWVTWTVFLAGCLVIAAAHMPPAFFSAIGG